MLGALDGGCHPSCGESGEEELAILPRHTKVVVTGNNRTKSVLVGLHGVVKKAVGLGGWHWLNLNLLTDLSLQLVGSCLVVLTNGIEVKLQRNALCVIEPPTGHEEDSEIECGNMQWNSSGIGFYDTDDAVPSLDIFLIKHSFDRFLCTSLCHAVTHGPYLSPSFLSLGWSGVILALPKCCNVRSLSIMRLCLSDDVQAQKPHISRVRHRKGSSYKSLSRSQSCDSHSKGSILSSRCKMKVDLSKLETRALWRYWRHFNLVDASPNPSKEQLIDVVQKHFMSQVTLTQSVPCNKLCRKSNLGKFDDCVNPIASPEAIG
ncbi:hypothetical protein ZIOFF_062137 [Zingiber officinale]|uniref:Histone deacetylase complex subunit SAP30 Sin3 binding domain-containing protein n=1 Tax=Zingiber officinale TaxID=94328 RepID=A0A8J5KIZ1_ZINOF|nr:hypothetical protein ZIOFF_062137 [Zingiber officinale]